MTRRYVLLCLLMAAAWVAQAQSTRRQLPNIVILLSDDQGWGDLSGNGNQNLQTPNIDRIGRNGATFQAFYVQPVCSPTRAELLTGRYHPRSGVYSTSEGGERLGLREMTLAEVFKKAGYATGLFGKWHSGMQPPYDPNSRGFDEFYGYCSGHWGNYFSSDLLEHNGNLVRGDGFLADDLTNRAMAFMTAHRREPFLLYLPFNTPHSPMQAPAADWARFKDKPLLMRAENAQAEDVPFTRAALAMCENIDQNVGRLMARLAQLGLTDNTIVLYFSDNGPNGVRWNGGMKGTKGSTDEGGVRSPLMMQFPKRIKPGTQVKSIAGAIDLLPTLIDLTGIRAALPNPLDGLSFTPALQNRPLPDRLLFAHWNGRTSVRTQQYRLDHQNKLYDLQTDPGQKTDISAQQPAVAQRLSQVVATWKTETFAGMQAGQRPVFTVGYSNTRPTQLPARDAQPVGGIKRSNKYPNSSFLTNWTALSDAIEWDIEVGQAGTYEAEIYYTCRPDDVGSTVQLRFGEQQVSALITEAYDPPLTGMDHDLVPRMESYVKAFKPLTLGTIQLSQGTGKLTLRALTVKGQQVMDFRTLVLRPVR